MKFFATLAATAAAIGAAAAAPGGGNYQSPSPIPGYPPGIPWCLSDQQANFIVKNYAALLSSPSGAAKNQTAQVSIADGYTETSDSIDILAGFPV